MNSFCTNNSFYTLAFWVNIAQIVSAIATAAAVYMSLHLSRRAEQQRPKVSIALQPVHTIGPDGYSVSHNIAVNVVNAGVLPITIIYAQLELYNRWGKQVWGTGLIAGRSGSQGLTIPNMITSRKLEHGQEWGDKVDVTPESPWKRGTKSYGLLRRQRPSLMVRSSLGKVFRVHMRRTDYRELQKFVHAPLPATGQ